MLPRSITTAPTEPSPTKLCGICLPCCPSLLARLVRRARRGLATLVGGGKPGRFGPIAKMGFDHGEDSKKEGRNAGARALLCGRSYRSVTDPIALWPILFRRSLGLHDRRLTHGTPRLASPSCGLASALDNANLEKSLLSPCTRLLVRALSPPASHIQSKMPKKAAVANYEPEKVVGSRGSGKNIEYEVKWVGFKAADNTWEPTANLASCKEVPRLPSVLARSRQRVEYVTNVLRRFPRR